MKTSIIIVAAGKGERFGQPKMDLKLAGKTLLEWCLQTVAQLPFEKEVIVVSPEEGGATRFESVKNGLKKARGELVMIHNVANPMASVEDFISVHEQLTKADVACFVGQKNVDTLRRMHEQKSETIDRKNMWRVQTPQGFHRRTLAKLVDRSEKDMSDEVQRYESVGLPVIALETSAMNQKITYPADLELLERYLESEILVGVGEDSHSFDEKGTMTLGGLQVDGLPKMKANSDGDVILHALFNAISSALGRGSLGPIGNPMVEQGILDSSKYLQIILDHMKKRGFRLNNVSISLECSTPKIEPIADALKKSLGTLLGLAPQKIGVTATSGEGLSSFGKGEGIHCTVMVSLVNTKL